MRYNLQLTWCNFIVKETLTSTSFNVASMSKYVSINRQGYTYTYKYTGNIRTISKWPHFVVKYPYSSVICNNKHNYSNPHLCCRLYANFSKMWIMSTNLSRNNTCDSVYILQVYSIYALFISDLFCLIFYWWWKTSMLRNLTVQNTTKNSREFMLEFCIWKRLLLYSIIWLQFVWHY